MTTSFGTDSGTTAAATVNEEGNIVIGDKVFTPEALSKKITSQDQHIATLESENNEHVSNSTKLLNRLDEIEKKVTDKNDITSLLSTLEQNKANTETPPANTEGNPDNPEIVSKDELVAEAVATINQQNTAQVQDQNLQQAVQLAKDTYGEGFSEKIDAMGAELGMPVEAVVEMAKKQPNAWKKLFLPKTDGSRSPDPTNASSTGSSAPPPPEKRGGYLAMRSNKDQRAEFKRRMDAKLNPQQ